MRRGQKKKKLFQLQFAENVQAHKEMMDYCERVMEEIRQHYLKPRKAKAEGGR